MTPGGIQANLIGGLLGAGAGGAWNSLHGKDVNTGAAYGGLLGAGLTHLTRGRWVNMVKQDLERDIARNVLHHLPTNTSVADYFARVHAPPTGLERLSRAQAANTVHDVIDPSNYQSILENSSFSRL